MKVAALGLALTLACASAQVNRPQTPQPPFPYRSLDVIVPSKAPGIRLACTLTMPDDDGPHRAMLVLAGSGPQDRDGNVFGHKPLLVMADYLTRRGTTVLRCDDRGTGNSTGRFLGSTTADFSLDAEGAFEYLSKRPGVTKAGIGGQSEGALIAAMVASRRQSAGFIVMLAGPGVKGETLGYAQAEAIQRAQKLPEDYIRSHRKMMAEMIALARTGATETQLLRHARVKFATIPDAEVAITLPELFHFPFHFQQTGQHVAKLRVEFFSFVKIIVAEMALKIDLHRALVCVAGSLQQAID